MTAVGSPFASKLAASTTQPEVHEPQSPTPATAAEASAEMPAMTSKERAGSYAELLPEDGLGSVPFLQLGGDALQDTAIAAGPVVPEHRDYTAPSSV